MIKSMTGYGKVTKMMEIGEVTIEVKSLNNRFIDIYLKMPEFLSDYEDEFKKLISEKLNRGSIKVVINIGNDDKVNFDYLHLNIPLMRRYYDELRKATVELGIRERINLSHILSISDYSELTIPEVDAQKYFEPVKEVLIEALNKVDSMRAEEGKAIQEFFYSYLGNIEKDLGRIEDLYKKNKEEIFKKLKEKVRLLLEDVEIDENRLIMEASILSRKLDITEECDRLHSHISQFKKFIELDQPVGKKLQFLIQEMNREANTIGSKSENAQISHIVVNIKDELEKIREQAQNIL